MLRIACDLDGTLADMEAALRREAAHLAGPGVQPRTDDLWAHVREVENFWMSLAEIEPGAVARLGALASLHGWEVLFLTQRPSTVGETTQVQTQRWLEAHGFELPSVFVTNGSRGAVAAALALDAVLDDRPENCLDVATDSKAQPFLVWRDTPQTVPAAVSRLGIETVFSMAEAFERLQQMPHSTPRTFVSRLRSVIGL